MKILIVGSGSTAITISEIIYNNKNFQIIGYVGTSVENKKIGKNIFRDLKYLGEISLLDIIDHSDASGFITAIGDRYLREFYYYKAFKSGKLPIKVISKESKISDNVSTGAGVVIFPHSLISHNVKIGENTFIESGVIIEPNCDIGSNCNLEAGCIVSGNTIIKKNTTIGKNSVIKNDLVIGKNQKISPNQYIDKNLEDIQREEIIDQ